MKEELHEVHKHIEHASSNVDADFKMGLTSFAYIIGFLSILYLVNFNDKDMRQYTYGTISNTISIFLAVLSYQCVDKIVEEIIPLEEQPFLTAFLKAVVGLAFWFSLAVFIGLSPRSIGKSRETVRNAEYEARGGDPKILEARKKREEEHKVKDVRGRMAAVLIFAHMTGFANIAIWGTLQSETKVFKQNFMTAILVSFLALVFYWVFIAFTAHASDWFYKRLKVEGSEKYQEQVADLYLDFFKDGENDAIGLAIAFPFVSALRFLISGVLPDAEGDEEAEDLLEHSWTHVTLLYLVAVLAVLAIVVPIVVAKKKREDSDTEEEEEYREGSDMEEEEAQEEKTGSFFKDIQLNLFDEARFKEMRMTLFAMIFVMSFYFASQWAIIKSGIWMQKRSKELDKSFVAMLNAMFVSVVGFLGILVLDEAADSDHTDAQSDKAIRKIIDAIGILIGFAWEQSFDKTMGTVVGVMNMGVWGQVILTVGVLVVIAPAWMRFVIPMKQEFGYRYGFITRALAARAENGFEDEEEYKGNLQRMWGYARLVRTLAAGLPEPDRKNNEYLPKSVQAQLRQIISSLEERFPY